MPLNHGYGVLVGTIQNYYRDDPDDFGQYYHANLVITARAETYLCAVDVDSHQSNTGVEWRTVHMPATKLSRLTTLGPGYHALVSNSGSGAVDYIRSQMFAGRLGRLAILRSLLRLPFDPASRWRRGTSLQALEDLEPLVTTTRANGLCALVFGEPFTVGHGVHNIHQNQGDPAGSEWWEANGIWQDGCVILQQSTDTYVAFMNKFTTQSYRTDGNGHPV